MAAYFWKCSPLIGHVSVPRQFCFCGVLAVRILTLTTPAWLKCLLSTKQAHEFIIELLLCGVCPLLVFIELTLHMIPVLCKWMALAQNLAAQTWPSQYWVQPKMKAVYIMAP